MAVSKGRAPETEIQFVNNGQENSERKNEKRTTGESSSY